MVAEGRGKSEKYETNKQPLSLYYIHQDPFKSKIADRAHFLRKRRPDKALLPLPKSTAKTFLF